ncbi:MAG: lamin tail domain-containing protein [Patescibacteria group bacterium]|nr:lamin tail domain-containing protein [Patescibacteria group bacterium]
MLKTLGLICLLFITISCWVEPEYAEANFSKSFFVQNNRLGLGDWTSPSLEIIQSPQENMAYESLSIRVKGVDTISAISNFEYLLYSHTPADLASDWVQTLKTITCDDPEENSESEGLTQEKEILLSLDKIENSNHKLCLDDEIWCEDGPLPAGEYYLIIHAYDSSQTLDVLGNKSEDLIYQFIKKEAQVICQLGTIKVKAGEEINFPNVTCADEPELEEIKWDLDEADGVDFTNPDLLGNAPILTEGITIPGTYSVTVEAKNIEGIVKRQSFRMDVSNPVLNYGDLIINEFIPNPVGDDKAVMPAGEWVEIYNKLAVGIDLLGFVVYDNYDEHDLPLTKNNCQDNSTLIFPHSYKVIYRNGDPQFSLNNSGLEKIRLFNGFIENEAIILTDYEYSGGVIEGKSLARMPNLDGDFQQMVPTPGEENKNP